MILTFAVAFLVLINNQRKKTPPIEAVIIPTGISTGETTVLDTVSASYQNWAWALSE